MSAVPGRERTGRDRDGKGALAPALPPLLRGLLRPRAYPHAAQDLCFVETHISWVLLAGAFAYKVKKPVKLNFLDYSTLERRQRACEEELRLNRRTAPELYLGVVPIAGTPARPRVGAAGAPIEYAVKMRRFPQESQLDRVLARGELVAREMEVFARDLAAFHDAAARANGDEGDAAELAHAPLRETLADLLAAAAGDPARAAALHTLRDWSEREYRVLERSFASRRRTGRVRECHGDLHLANLARLDGRIVAFDAIEFSASLRTCDVISDVAFLFMDLCTRGREDFAYRFLDGWLQATGDYAAVPLLRYYLVYRALVRAKVAAIRRDMSPPAGRGVHDRDVERYVAWALERTRPRYPRLVLMHGLSGSGKTWLSGQLIPLLPAVRLRSDVERKRLLGLAELARTGSAVGAGAYAPAITDQVYARLERAAEAVLAGEENVIVDAAFLERARRRRFFELARRHGVPCAVVDCRAPAATLEQRVAERSRAAADASEAGLAVLRRQQQAEERLDRDEQRLARRVTAGDDAQDVARELMLA